MLTVCDALSAVLGAPTIALRALFVLIHVLISHCRHTAGPHGLKRGCVSWLQDAILAVYALKLGGLLGSGIDQRQANSAYRETGQFQCFFYQDGVRCLNSPSMRGDEAFVCGSGFFPLAGRSQLYNLLHSEETNVSDGGDDAHYPVS